MQPNPLTVAQVIDAFCAAHPCPAKGHKARVERRRRNVVRKFRETHGENAAEQCTITLLEEWIASRTDWKTEQVRTWARYCVFRVFQWARDSGLVPANPFRKKLIVRRRALTSAVPPAPGEVPTVNQVISLYIAAKELQVRDGMYCQRGLERLQHYLRSFAEMFGTLPVTSCRKIDLVKWLQAHPHWKSSHTKIDATGTVVTCFRWAEEAEYIARNPYRRPRGMWSSPGPRSAITPDEYEAVMLAARRSNGRTGRCYPSWRAFRRALWFLWQTGCRGCEMREVCWVHVDWQAGVVRLPEHKTARKTGQPRIIGLNRKVLRFLRWLHRHGGELPSSRGRIFVNNLGKPWTCDRFAKAFRLFAEKAGVRSEVSPYSARHAFCVRGLEAGIGTRQLSDALGHASSRYVDWYGKSTRANAAYLRGIADALAD